MHAVIRFLTPWEFSPTVLACCLLAGGVYARGLAVGRARGRPAGFARALSFYVGLVLIYLMLQSYYDYLSQHMFWVHRLQHLILHHVAPFLVMLAVPGETLALGLPAPLRERLLRPLLWSAPVRLGYRCVQQPLVASLLFVGLIYFWLIPSVHFDAMLSATRYRIMNWSMVLDGLLFWWLVVSPHRPGAGGLGYGVRIGMLWGVMLPQLALGAYIALHGTVLYDVYAVCGRAWPLSPLVDQEVGGLLTWIPPGMMSAIGMLVVLRMWIHDDARRHPSARSAGALAGQSR